jgi:hypothetical protein
MLRRFPAVLLALALPLPVFAAAPPCPDVSLQGSVDPSLAALKARLDALERQNEELLQKIEQGTPISAYRPEDGSDQGMTVRWDPLKGVTFETANRDFVFHHSGWLSHEDIQWLNKFLGDDVKECVDGRDGNPLMGLLLEPGKTEVVCGWWDVGSPPPSLASGGLETTPITSMHLGGQFDFTLFYPGKASLRAAVPPARGGSGPVDRKR